MHRTGKLWSQVLILVVFAQSWAMGQNAGNPALSAPGTGLAKQIVQQLVYGAEL